MTDAPEEPEVFRISCHTVGESDASYTVWLQFLDSNGQRDETDVGDYDTYRECLEYILSRGGTLIMDDDEPETQKKADGVIDKPRAEKMVKALMAILPFDDGETVFDYGFTITAKPETIELLKQSDSTFAGYVISAISPPEDSKKHYDDWVLRTLKRTMK